MGYLFTSESVSNGHPDKVADQISDAILDSYLAQDSTAHVAVETFVTSNNVVIGGEVSTKKGVYVDVDKVAREVIRQIGYTREEYNFSADTCKITNLIHSQSADINQGVAREDEQAQGAGDQGIMFGYACKDTAELMPITLALSHILLLELNNIRQQTTLMPYLRPDAKSQVTVEYDQNGQAERIHTIVLSTQHDEFIVADEKTTEQQAEEAMQKKIREDIVNILIPRVIERHPSVKQYFKGDYILHVNPTGKFVIGGPDGDTGLTGRKIIVDTYGGKGAHGGGAFSGKDPSKVDRSAAYAARHIAKNLVAAGVADEILVQVAYAIGVAQPVSIYVNSYGTAHVALNDAQIAQKVASLFDLTPYGINKRLGLTNPIYAPTASFGHMGRNNCTTERTFIGADGKPFTQTVELFTWEKCDYVEQIKELFGI